VVTTHVDGALQPKATGQEWRTTPIDAARARFPQSPPASIFAPRMNALIALIGGALLIVGTWLLLAAALAGVGLLLRHLWRRSEPIDPDEGFTLI
jgi:hypothetical protein